MIYKHPHFSKKMLFEHFQNILKKLSDKNLIFGDINIDMNTNKGSSFNKLMNSFHLHSQLNFKYPSTQHNTHVDICFSNIKDMTAWYYETYYTYHKPICMVIHK